MTDVNDRKLEAPGPVKALRGEKEDESRWVAQCNQWAQEDYGDAVQRSRGSSQVARNEECDESTVRARTLNPRKRVHLAHCYAGLEPEGLELLAERLKRLAAVKRSGRAA